MANRSVLRRIERTLLGAAFGVVAFVIERRVLRSIKKGASGKKKEPGLSATGGADGLSMTPE